MDRLREKKERLQKLKKEAQLSSDKSEQPQLSTFDILATAMTRKEPTHSIPKKSQEGNTTAEAVTVSALPPGEPNSLSSSATGQHMPSPESINDDVSSPVKRTGAVRSGSEQRSKMSPTEQIMCDVSSLSPATEERLGISSDTSKGPPSDLGAQDLRKGSIDEEEVDEFGRVKRRRQRYSNGPSSHGHHDDSDTGSHYDSDYEDRHPRRRRRSHSEDGHRRHGRSQARCSSRSRSPRSRSRSGSRSRTRHRDPYTAAARYIDTEFFPTKIYVGDLIGVTKDHLEDAFAAFGRIEEIKTVEGKDFAFITYDDPESALYAIKKMDGAKLGRYRIKVNRAKIPERNRVGFGNIPWKDEDGVVAQEESYSKPRSSAINPEVDPRAIGRGRQVLSYDDL